MGMKNKIVILRNQKGGIAHSNCLNAKDTPNITTGPPTGTLSYYLVTALWPAGITPGMKVLVLA